jgi:hypothetical protein
MIMNTRETSEMRELTDSELNEVAGGNIWNVLWTIAGAAADKMGVFDEPKWLDGWVNGR